MRPSSRRLASSPRSQTSFALTRTKFSARRSERSITPSRNSYAEAFSKAKPFSPAQAPA